MIRTTCFIALFALVTAASLSYENEWESFKAKYNKVYADEREEAWRKTIFLYNLKKIQAHNERAENGELTYRLEVNKFSDLTDEEFKAAHLGFKKSDQSEASLSNENEWESFKAKHNKVYADEREEAWRKTVFLYNLKKIQAHNERADNGEHTYRLGVNKFADLTYEEFKAAYLGFKKSQHSAPLVHNVNKTFQLPASIDWRTKGIVTEVKDQAFCESCWAFSAIASIESANAQKTGKLVELSEENLIECSWGYHNKGCSGGLMDSAFQYVIDNKGVATESSYPYTSAAGDSGKCKYSASKRGASISSYVDIPQGNENALLQAVAQRVVSVAVDASELQHYDSGILKSTKCSPQGIDHGVTIVGYGVDNGTPYWLIKNSWGADFGENGYFRLYRGSNMCGVAEAASYPVV
ncbi:cathepsin L1 [Tetranychus urticae]|uniref:Uncharacterized protein n=1 Tax=Tetranychus urticae TaxID=32264 RepID=T1JY67_TETUR|nr:cathepsin L1 [Tetranychus urticae]